MSANSGPDGTTQPRKPGGLRGWLGASPRRRRLVAAFAIFYLVVFFLLFSISGPGVTWDETYYLTGGHDFYLPWFARIGTDALSEKAISDHWAQVNWHPPLGQLFIGLSQKLFAGWLGRLVGGRLATALLFAALAAGLYLFMAEHYGDKVGLLSAVCLVGMPRVFGHAHFAALDLPVAAAWFAVTASFVLGLTSRPWRIVAGLGLGAALLVKTSLVPLPLLLLAWALLYYGRRAKWPGLALGLAVPVFFLWPWLWVDTLEHLKGYFGAVHDRPLILVYYFGESLAHSQVPFHYPLVMTLSTTPLLILFAALAGAIHTLRKAKADPVGVLLVATVGYVLAIASAPGIPRYDGVRLFLQALPFLAALAGIGLARAWDYAREQFALSRRTGQALAGVFVAYHLGWLLALHPFYLSDYGGLVGALPGASRLGLETTYWCDALDAKTRDYLNRHAPENARIAIQPYPELMALFFRDHVVFREDLSIVDRTRDQSWDILVLVCRRGMFDEELWRYHLRGTPLFERRLLGVPLCQVFKRMDPGP